MVRKISSASIGIEVLDAPIASPSTAESAARIAPAL
jgi:hypothetical protein